MSSELIGLYNTKLIRSVITDRDTGKCKYFKVNYRDYYRYIIFKLAKYNLESIVKMFISGADPDYKVSRFVQLAAVGILPQSSSDSLKICSHHLT